VSQLSLKDGGKTLRWLYIIVVVLYLLIGLVFVGPALATDEQHTLNPVAPIPTSSSRVPTGNDDATVQAYYDYLNTQQLSTLREQYVFNWQNFVVTYLEMAVFVIVFLFLAFAWYARRKTADIYPIEVFNGVITERAGPVDPFNWAVYSILGTYMVYYIVVHLIYGQLY
jgi:hypothetical protein